MVCERLIFLTTILWVVRKSISHGKPYNMHFLAYFSLQITLMYGGHVLHKVEYYENHVRCIYLTTVLNTGESRTFRTIPRTCPHSDNVSYAHMSVTVPEMGCLAHVPTQRLSQRKGRFVRSTQWLSQRKGCFVRSTQWLSQRKGRFVRSTQWLSQRKGCFVRSTQWLSQRKGRFVRSTQWLSQRMGCFVRFLAHVRIFNNNHIYTNIRW